MTGGRGKKKEKSAKPEINRDKHGRLKSPEFHRVEIGNILITLMAICTLPNWGRSIKRWFQTMWGGWLLACRCRSMMSKSRVSMIDSVVSSKERTSKSTKVTKASKLIQH